MKHILILAILFFPIITKARSLIKLREDSTFIQTQISNNQNKIISLTLLLSNDNKLNKDSLNIIIKKDKDAIAALKIELKNKIAEIESKLPKANGDKSKEEQALSDKNNLNQDETDNIKTSTLDINDKNTNGNRLTEGDKILKKENLEAKSLNNKLSIFWKVLGFLLLLSVLALIYLYKEYKKLKNNMKENKISLEEKIGRYKELIISFNTLLNSLNDNTKVELVSNFNTSIGTSQEAKFENIESIIQSLDLDFKNISKQAQDNVKIINEQKEKIKVLENEAKSPEINNLYIKASQEKEKLQNELNSIKKETGLIIPTYSIPADTFINSNILVSAGPRKDKEKDTELGEDSCGIYNTPEGTYFWILDGTSDSKQIESENKHIFSSRLLAQQMSNNFQEIIGSNEFNNLKEKKSLKFVLEKAVLTTEKSITEGLKNASAEIQKEITQSFIENNNPFCSTTVLLGLLSKNGELRYFYLGDSIVLSFKNINGNYSLIQNDKNENPSRLFMSLVQDGNSFSIQKNDYSKKVVEPILKQNVDYILAFSDGIGVSEKALTINPKLLLSKIAFTEQKTYDDKTLIVLERVKFN